MFTLPFGITYSPDLSTAGEPTPAGAAFASAIMGGEPDGAAPTAPATQSGEPTTEATPAARADGVTLEPDFARALQNAGIDPLNASTQELLDFANRGNKALFEKSQKEKKLRQAIEADKTSLEQALASLSLEKVLGEGSDPAKLRENIADIQGRVSRLGDLESNLLVASEQGLISPEVFEAVRTARGDSAATIFRLLAQVQSASAQSAAVKAAGVGTTVTQPTKDAPETDDFSFKPNTPEFKAADAFISAWKSAKPATPTHL